MFKLINSETTALTRELAENFKGMPAAPVERDLEPRRVKHLTDRAEAGLLTTFSWAKVKLPDGNIYRMNGQHSSNMLCDLNGSFPDGLYAHIDTYEVDGADGMALLFRQFDARQSGRSAADVSGAYQCLHPEIEGVPRSAAKLAVEAVCHYRRNVSGAPAPTGDDRYNLFNETVLFPFIKFTGDTIGMKQPEMKKEPVVSAMYATFQTNEVAAREFWGIVARGGDELDTDHAASVLSCFLQKVKSKDVDPSPKPMHLYQACIHAWNAYRASTECKINVKRIMGAKELYEPHA